MINPSTEEKNTPETEDNNLPETEKNTSRPLDETNNRPNNRRRKPGHIALTTDGRPKKFVTDRRNTTKEWIPRRSRTTRNRHRSETIHRREPILPKHTSLHQLQKQIHRNRGGTKNMRHKTINKKL